jgi:hypothetical protein
LRKIGFPPFRDLDELWTTMTHLHHRRAAAVPVEHLLGRVLQDFARAAHPGRR